MPVTSHSSSNHILYQRDQYKKGGLGRIYWDYRDKIVLSFLDDKDNYIIDLGCGEGITLEKLVMTFPSSKVYGIDLLDENIEICRKHDLPVKKGESDNIDLPDDTVDAVVFMEVIEHLYDPSATVNEIYRILKPEGKLIVVYPNDTFFKIARILTFRFREAAYDPGHIKQWTPAEMKQFLKKNGFAILRTKCLPFFFWDLSLHGLAYAIKKI